MLGQRIIRRLLLLIFSCLSLLVSGSVSANQQALEAFNYLHEVVTGDHRRCTNCHGADGKPTVGNDGRQHPMNVSKQIEELGMGCEGCHAGRHTGDVGADGTIELPQAHLAGMPPRAGTPSFHWHMPPERMKVSTSTSAKELCKIWLDWVAEDPEKHSLLTHMQTDPLVQWSFQEHPGRKVAPGGHAKFIEKLKVWLGSADGNGGTPICP